MTQIEKVQEIGTAILNYNPKGEFINASFKPSMEITLDQEGMKAFETVVNNQDEKIVKEQACNVFAAWFQKINEIELADQLKYMIDGEFAGPCEKYEDGKIKSCTIKFVFKPRENAGNTTV